MTHLAGRPATLSRTTPAPAVRRLPLRLRLWHWLLTPGWVVHTPAATLRGWTRVLKWGRSGHAQRLRLVQRAIWTPVRAWKEATAAVVEVGDAIETAIGVPRSTQRRRIWWMAVRHGLVPLTYVEYQLYRPERWRRAAAYLQEPEHTYLLRWLHRLDEDRAGAIFREKRVFAEWCRAHALPSIPTLLEFDDGHVAVSHLEDGRTDTVPRVDLFSKPSNGTSGHGVERWTFVGTDERPAWRATDGRARTEAELLAELAGLSLTLELREGRTSRRMLLQRCVQNHRALLPLTPGALCTVRVVTYREPGGGAITLRASFRMAVGDAAADNYAVGGIVAPIDVATGRLLQAYQRTSRIQRPIERHPDTGTVIAGFQLPYWTQVLAVCERGLDAAADLPTIGWDVAITDAGPVLVEGNVAPNPGIVQKQTGIPLSETPFPDVLARWVRDRLSPEAPR